MQQSVFNNGRAARTWFFAAALLATVSALACDDGEKLVHPGVSLSVHPERVVVQSGQQVELTAELVGAPTGTVVRWLTADSTRFQLDTTTTGPHRVLGRGGRIVGASRVFVMTGTILREVEVLVNMGASAGVPARE
jgi:hypothetical protein